MSIISENKQLGVSFASLTDNNIALTGVELEVRMKALLQAKVHGMSFSPYMDGQTPLEKSKITDEQIRTRMSIISPYTEWIRVFSCTDGNELIPKIAKELGHKTMVGGWLDDNKEMNAEEIARLIKVGKAGDADIIAVGNEVMLRGDLTEDELLGYLKQVKEALPEVTIGYVDAYYIFNEYPRIVEACDVILANCYPFWEKCPIDVSVDYMKHMYSRAQEAAKGKPVVISETGWPNEGEAYGGAVPSYENAMKYFVGTYEWAKADGVEVIYFSSFDEEWKVHHEGECGAYWGIWDKDNQYKFESDKG